MKGNRRGRACPGVKTPIIRPVQSRITTAKRRVRKEGVTKMYLGAKTLLVALIGMLVVFLGLVVLIVLINIMGKLTGGMNKKEAPKAAAPVAAPSAAPAAVASLIKPDAQVRPAQIDDTTVAVLTAAIAQTRGEGYPFKIKRIVRVKR